MQVKIKYLHPDAKTPTYATDGSACFDLYAATVSGDVEYAGGKYADTFHTGLAFEIPQGYCMKVYSRSGISFKHNKTLCNAVGIIDADYKGEVIIRYSEPIPYGAGDRIAQAEIVPVERIEFELSETLSETKRGQNGFGSSGVK